MLTKIISLAVLLLVASSAYAAPPPGKGKHKPVNGTCGSADGVPVSTAPTSGLCSSGSATAVSGSGPWTWSCVGTNGGTTAQCSAPVATQPPPPVNGQCGPANGTPTSTKPTTGLCSVGTATSVSGSGPWTWGCNGSNGGTNASCSAPLPNTGQNVPCNGDITAPLQSAISAAANGTIVNVGAGSCSMSSKITINDKNIIIKGAGKGVTNITANSGFGTFNVSGANVPTFRLSGMSFSGTTNVVFLSIWGNHSATFRGPFRIDHLSLNYPNANPDGLIAIWGPVYGLIDHNDFTMLGEAAILTSLETDTENCSYNVGGPCDMTTLAGAAGLALPYFPGGASNLYVEDNTFTGKGPQGTAALDTAYRGGRIVFRHNMLMNTILYAHWTNGGNVNSLWWEIYNNKFTWTLGQDYYPMRMQGGGTGLIYNNTFVGFPNNYIVVGEGRNLNEGQSGPPLGYCDGTHDWDGNAGDPSAAGWPCLAQTGRDAGKTIAQIEAGDKEASFPLYVWNNGSQDTCSTGGSCDNSFTVFSKEPEYIRADLHNTTGFGNGDVDYSISASQPTGAGTHILIYTPYIYPHPLATP
jgi:hypothetical protein